MKKILLFSFLFAISAITFAQNITTKLSQESKEISIGQATSTNIIDAQNNQILLITNQKKRQPIKEEYRRSDYVIMKVDTNLSIKSQTVLKQSKKQELLAYSTTNTQIILLMRTINKKNNIISKIEIERESLTVQCETPIDTINLQKKDNLYLWCKDSPNSQYTALTYIIENPSQEKWDCYALMLNKSLSVQWKKQPQTYAINDIFVSDNAELYIVGNHCDTDNSTTEFYYEMIHNDKHNIITNTHNNILLDSYILNVDDSKMIIAGCTYSQNSPKNKIAIGGMYGMAFDFNTKLSNLEIYEFNHNDICVLYNEDITKIKIPLFIDNLMPTNIQKTTNKGGVMTVQRQLEITDININDKTKKTFINMGLFAINIDHNGHIIWTKAFRHLQSQINGEHYLNHILLTDSTNTYIIQSEHHQNIPTYNINDAIKELSPMNKKANVAIYKIDKEGYVTKQILTENKTDAIYGQCNQWFNNYQYYIMGNKKSCRLLTFSR